MVRQDRTGRGARASGQGARDRGTREALGGGSRAGRTGPDRPGAAGGV